MSVSEVILVLFLIASCPQEIHLKIIFDFLFERVLKISNGQHFNGQKIIL